MIRVNFTPECLSKMKAIAGGLPAIRDRSYDFAYAGAIIFYAAAQELDPAKRAAFADKPYEHREAGILADMAEAVALARYAAVLYLDDAPGRGPRLPTRVVAKFDGEKVHIDPDPEP